MPTKTKQPHKRPTAASESGRRGISAQDIADVLALACCAVSTDQASRTPAALSLLGALTAPIAIASLPFLLFGAASRAALIIVLAHAAAAALRYKAVSLDDDGASPLDRPEANAINAWVGAFTLVPEAAYRWALFRGEPWSVEIWRGGGRDASLHVGGLPSPRHVRHLAREQAVGTCRVLVINCCRSWAGWTEAYASLGLEQLRMPAAQVDVLQVVHTLRRELLAPTTAPTTSPTTAAAGGAHDGATNDGRPLRLYVHCEGGAYALCAAAAFLAAENAALDPPAAAAKVCALAAGRLRSSPKEAERLTRLVLSLAHPKRAQNGANAQHGAKAAGRAAAPAAKAASSSAVSSSAAAAADAADDDDADDDEEDADEEAEREAERAERWAKYQEAVAKHGLPGSAPAAHNDGGWVEVGAPPPKRPGAVAHSYAAAAAAAQAQANREAAAAQAMSDKQRKNKRKNEKAKEETLRREAEQQARLQATIRERARG